MEDALTVLRRIAADPAAPVKCPTAREIMERRLGYPIGDIRSLPKEYKVALIRIGLMLAGVMPPPVPSAEAGSGGVVIREEDGRVVRRRIRKNRGEAGNGDGK